AGARRPVVALAPEPAWSLSSSTSADRVPRTAQATAAARPRPAEERVPRRAGRTTYNCAWRSSRRPAGIRPADHRRHQPSRPPSAPRPPPPEEPPSDPPPPVEPPPAPPPEPPVDSPPVEPLYGEP